MTRINLRETIEAPINGQPANFTGAVFLTYTLNLSFFEQIIIPALERTGCQSILVIADPDGYHEAIKFGQKNVRFAGSRYVCTFLPRQGHNVAHAKLLFLVGPKQGRLLIGSGNLTMYGYSKNLEIFDHFEYAEDQPSPQTLYPFEETALMLSQLCLSDSPSAAGDQYSHIVNAIDWLDRAPEKPDDITIWHNLDEGLWAQLSGWWERNAQQHSLRDLKIFSPYYDRDAGKLIEFVHFFQPEKLSLYLNQKNTNLDSPHLRANWPESVALPGVFNTQETQKDTMDRLLHGKLILGKTDQGSFCLSGSANMTRAAFDHTWGHGSNLEMVTLRTSDNPNAFDDLLNENFFTEIPIDSIQNDLSELNSEEPQQVFENMLTIIELSYRDHTLSGRINHLPETDEKEILIRFLKSGDVIMGTLNEDLSFRAHYAGKLLPCEAVTVRIGNIKSLPRWIDRLGELNNYRNRSYQQRVAANLETIPGTESLFREMMEHLFDQVELPSGPTPKKNGRSKKPGTQDPKNEQEIPEAPEAEKFIIPERDDYGNFILNPYTNVPYDRSIKSFRDLLSIILLRLTTTPDETPPNDIDDQSGENEETQTEEEQNIVLVDARERICSYILGYCKRYSRKLMDQDFLKEIPPELFANKQATLCRVLLEFNTHLEEFTTKNFQDCFWSIWTPLIWPALIQLEDKPCIESYEKQEKLAEFKEAWQSNQLSEFLMLTTYLAFGSPPSWKSGLYQHGKVNQFLVLKELLEKFESNFDFADTHLTEMDNLGISVIQIDACEQVYASIKSYMPPVLERISPILRYSELKKDDREIPPSLLEAMKQNDLLETFTAYQQNPAPICSVKTAGDDHDRVYCPRCGGALLEPKAAKLGWGKLVLCTANKDAWLYQAFEISKPIQF